MASPGIARPATFSAAASTAARCVPAGHFRGQLAQAGDAPLTDHRSVSSVTTHSMPDHLAAVVGQRRIGKGVIGLFGIAAAFQEQQQAFVPGRLAGLQHLVDARTDVGPDFLPHLAGRRAQRPVVLDAQGGAVGVVVEEGEFLAPAHPHLIARGQKNAHHGAQALRPGFRRPERSLGPVMARMRAPISPPPDRNSKTQGGQAAPKKSRKSMF